MFFKQRIPGRLILDDGLAALEAATPADGSAPHVYLSYAFVTLGVEEHLLPNFILDDWGNEFQGLELYRWVGENGLQFPRAELFCVGLDGEERQHFLRELDLVARFPAYAFDGEGAPIGSAVLLNAVLLVDDSVIEPTPGEAPEGMESPLRQARIDWWRVPPGVVRLDFLTNPR